MQQRKEQFLLIRRFGRDGESRRSRNQPRGWMDALRDSDQLTMPPLWKPGPKFRGAATAPHTREAHPQGGSARAKFSPGFCSRQAADWLCDKRRTEWQGTRKLALDMRRVDHSAAMVEIGRARAIRGPARISALSLKCVDDVDTGFGIDGLRLSVVATQPLAPEQIGDAQVRQRVSLSLPAGVMRPARRSQSRITYTWVRAPGAGKALCVAGSCGSVAIPLCHAHMVARREALPGKRQSRSDPVCHDKTSGPRHSSSPCRNSAIRERQRRLISPSGATERKPWTAVAWS